MTLKGEIVYWLTPVASAFEQSAKECVNHLVGNERIYAFRKSARGRKHLKAGDRICFYASKEGVIADAKVASSPEEKPHPSVRQPDEYPWVFKLEQIRLYLDNPVVVDAKLRQKLEAFEGLDHNHKWSWLVQITQKVSKHDFNLLTRTKARR